MDTLAAKDPRLAPLIKETEEFRIEADGSDSPYEILLECIAYQSISGKAAATIFGRIKALGSDGRPPSPEQMLDRKSTRLNSSHGYISYAVFCLKKKKNKKYTVR